MRILKQDVEATTLPTSREHLLMAQINIDPAAVIRDNADTISAPLLARCLYKNPLATLRHAGHRLSLGQAMYCERYHPGSMLLHMPSRIAEDDIEAFATSLPVLTAQQMPSRLTDPQLDSILANHRQEMSALLNTSQGSMLARRLQQTGDAFRAKFSDIFDAIPTVAIAAAV